MAFLIALMFLVLLLIILYVFATHAFKIAQVPHEETPEEYDIPFREIRFPTQNGRSLYAWWIPALEGVESANATLILVHGWKRNVGRMLTYIRHLYPSNFNMLAFDARHHGSSDPDEYSTMVKFAQDTVAAVDRVCQYPIDQQRIGLVGLSLGGAASIYAAKLEPRIAEVVTVGAPAHPGDIIHFDMKRRGIPYFPLVWFMLRFFQYKIGLSMDEIAPENNINATGTHYLFIQGGEDETVPVEHAQRLYTVAGPERAELWLYPRSGHSNCHRADGFWPRLQAYLIEKFTHDEE